MPALEPSPRPVRCFVGLPLPEGVQEALARVIHRLAGSLASRISWTRPGNAHVTLKFLGNVDEARLPALVDALRGVDFAPFALALGPAGSFPPPNMQAGGRTGGRTGRGRPRALWLGLARGGAQSVRLAAQVERALLPLGFAPGVRAFTPHVTLGRVKDVKNAQDAQAGDDWGEVERACARESWPAAEVSRFVLWRSDLGPGGPRYSVLAEFPARSA